MYGLETFTKEEKNNTRTITTVEIAEMLVSSLMEYGWGFDEIKDFVLNRANRLIED